MALCFRLQGIGMILIFTSTFIKNLNILMCVNLVYTRSLNYQWELEDFAEPYYHAGRDVNNFYMSLKFTYFGNW